MSPGMVTSNAGPHLSLVQPGAGGPDPLPLPRLHDGDEKDGQLTGEERPTDYIVKKSCV